MSNSSPRISATIITKNEERNIRRCLESIKWVDEIIVLDSGSTDKTVDICREFTSNVFQVEWLGYGKTKQSAVDKATSPWILSIDADEEITPKLADVIREKVLNPGDCNGFEIKRKSQYLGKWIRHSGWNRDYPMRLFRKDSGHFNDKLVHESVIINGKRCRIHEEMLHYTYPDLETHLRKIDKYAECWAEEKALKGKKGSLHGTFLHTVLRFIFTYFLKLGFLDGKTGLILAMNSALSVYMKHMKLWERTRKK
ncbi:MAG TPA: glycosyltransferase family 2 protein [Candidatus Cloacimonadota bacterium]|nr:glycosyltransferase family 2 protein [Candidatus Cloacimonadota bacterium]HPT71892.1 glycosyltransferase family 2 protein [Candidatus Cloacimonadota bacterium]